MPGDDLNVSKLFRCCFMFQLISIQHLQKFPFVRCMVESFPGIYQLLGPSGRTLKIHLYQTGPEIFGAIQN